MNLNDFSKAKVGDVVTCTIYGEGTIYKYKIDDDNTPIYVDFGFTQEWYTIDGKLNSKVISTLFKGRTKTEIVVKKVDPYQENELILVRENESVPWKLAKFISINSFGNVCACLMGLRNVPQFFFSYHCSIHDLNG